MLLEKVMEMQHKNQRNRQLADERLRLQREKGPQNYAHVCGRIQMFKCGVDVQMFEIFQINGEDYN